MFFLSKKLPFQTTKFWAGNPYIAEKFTVIIKILSTHNYVGNLALSVACSPMFLTLGGFVNHHSMYAGQNW